jgi:hypothetical protein
MGAEYTHAVTVNNRQTVNPGPVALPAATPTVLQAWTPNARSGQQLRFLAWIDNSGANPITAVTIRGSNALAGTSPYSDTNALIIAPGQRAWFEAPGPPPEFWRLEATSLLGTTCAFGWAECFVVSQ